MNRRGFLAALVAAPLLPLAAPEKSVALTVGLSAIDANLGTIEVGRVSALGLGLGPVRPLVFGRCVVDPVNADEMNPFSLSVDQLSV